MEAKARKVISLGGMLVVSLPIKWVKTHNIQKGDSILASWVEGSPVIQYLVEPKEEVNNGHDSGKA